MVNKHDVVHCMCVVWKAGKASILAHAYSLVWLYACLIFKDGQTNDVFYVCMLFNVSN